MTQLGFKNMADILPEAAHGEARIKHVTISPEVAAFENLRMTFGGFGQGRVDPGTYARLYVGPTLMMSDTPMERRSNIAVVTQARGRVFIAGLGLGVILLPILAKRPEVSSVLVLEKSQDVIDLVGPKVRAFPGADKLEILQADVLEWKPPKGRMWDVIYFDIWPTISTDNLSEIATLHRRYARRKPADGWMDSWQSGFLRDLRRRDREGRW